MTFDHSAPPYEALVARVLAWIKHWSRHRRGASGRTGVRFDNVALDLFRYQFEAIGAYRAFCMSRDRTPQNVVHWRDVPLVPVSAFKHRPLATLVAMAAPACVFETSGTSDGRPGRVLLGDSLVYDASLRAAFRRWVVPDGAPGGYRCISLVPDRSLRPRSSLGHMVQTLFDTWDDGGGAWLLRKADSEGVDDGGVVDVAALIRDLRLAAVHRVPVLLFATSIALEMALQQWPEGSDLRLPEGSRIMDTGGPKGRNLNVDRLGQHAALCGHLGVEPWQIVGELGMTELCSQRYETTLRAQVVGDETGARVFAGPPWLRSVVLEPGTLTPLPEGEVGIIGHVDLANIDTCAFILTADLGRVVAVPGVGSALQLEGRVPGAQWRGCGLDVADLSS